MITRPLDAFMHALVLGFVAAASCALAVCVAGSVLWSVASRRVRQVCAEAALSRSVVRL